MSLHDDYTRLHSEREQLQRALTDEHTALERTLGERPSLLAQLQALFQRRFPPLTVTPDDAAAQLRSVDIWPEPAQPASQPAPKNQTSAAPVQVDRLERLIADGESLLVQLTTVSLAAAARAESVLVIDLRGGWVESFVAVPQFDGRIAAEPCMIQVDGPAGPDSRARTPLFAHKEVESAPWKPVTQERLDELRATGASFVTSNALETAIAAPPGPVYDRLLSSFLPRSITVDYDRVAFVVDTQQPADWLRGFLTRMAPRLDTNGSTRWRDALIFVVDAALDAAPFACFTEFESADAADACVLLFDAPDKARMFDVSSDGTAIKTAVNPARATHVLLVGAPQKPQPGVLTFRDADALRAAGLIGYMQPQLRIDENRVETLRQECARLQEQLTAQQDRTRTALQLNQRAGRVLASA